jgi:hypothetical protein
LKEEIQPVQRLTLIAATLSLLAGAAGPVFAEEACSGSGAPLSRSAIEAQLKTQGYTQIKEIRSHNGCYEAKGFDQTGKRFELEINSFTGAISQAEE